MTARQLSRYNAAMKPSMSDLVGGTLDEFGTLPREDKLVQSLANPTKAGALTPHQMNGVSKARIRHKITTLISLEVPNIQEALAALLAENPKVYLDQVMALAEFALPKLKSVEIDVSANSESAKTLSLAELQSALTDDTVVSVQ